MKCKHTWIFIKTEIILVTTGVKNKPNKLKKIKDEQAIFVCPKCNSNKRVSLKDWDYDFYIYDEEVKKK